MWWRVQCAVYQTAFVSDEGPCLVAAAIGVEEERRRAESQLVHYAFHDPLTGPEPGITNGPVKAYTQRAKRRQVVYLPFSS